MTTLRNAAAELIVKLTDPEAESDDVDLAAAGFAIEAVVDISEDLHGIRLALEELAAQRAQ